MEQANAGVQILDERECWNLLGSHAVGRLAVDIAGRPDIFPINYLVDTNGDDPTIVFRTEAGTKLAGSALMHHVAFEIDGYEPHDRDAWSVVVHGEANLIEHMQDVYDAQDLPLFPWVATIKPNFVRITPTLVSGRRFHVVDDVAPDASIGWAGTDTDTDRTPHPGEPKIHPD